MSHYYRSSFPTYYYGNGVEDPSMSHESVMTNDAQNVPLVEEPRFMAAGSRFALHLDTT